jgi:hypothetical protein
LSLSFPTSITWHSKNDIVNNCGPHINQGSSTSGNVVAMQTDGNLVMYNSSNVAVWETITDGNPGAFLNRQEDGNLVVYSSGSSPLWCVH